MAGARALRSNTRFDHVVLVTCIVLAAVTLVLPAAVREPIAATLRRSLLAPMVMLQERAELSRRAFLLHDERAAARDTVTMRALGVSVLEAENEQLRRTMGLGSRLRWGFVPAEALHGRGVRDEYSVILTAGSRAGVQRLSPVVAPDGLVGMVDRVDPTMSQAILWTHPDFRVSAMSADGAAFGIVQAHLGQSASRFMLEMRGVPFRAILQPGAVIVSAGLGGTYPRGIPIGVVVSEIRTAEAWARTYILRPAVMPADVNSVMILRPERVAAGVENVWEYGTGDPTIQAIVAAGDSIAREAALAEAAARRAALDTLAGVPVPPGPSATQPPGTALPATPQPPPQAVPQAPAPRPPAQPPAQAPVQPTPPPEQPPRTDTLPAIPGIPR
jgi:rod shape-determining protein MreC